MNTINDIKAVLDLMECKDRKCIHSIRDSIFAAEDAGLISYDEMVRMQQWAIVLCDKGWLSRLS